MKNLIHFYVFYKVGQFIGRFFLKNFLYIVGFVVAMYFYYRF